MLKLIGKLRTGLMVIFNTTRLFRLHVNKRARNTHPKNDPQTSALSSHARDGT